MALTISSFSFAQTGSRPKLFERFPDQINLNAITLEQAMDAREGQEITLSFGGGFNFQGTVLSNETKYGKLQTILIKSLLLTIPFFPVKDHRIRYACPLLREDHQPGRCRRLPDQKDAAEQYQLAKISTETVLQDCSYQ